jgi:hypothetical protein
VVEHMCTAFGFKKRKIINLGWCEPAEVFDSVVSLTEKVSGVLAIGNIGGMGAAVVKEFENRSMIYG